MALWLLQHGRFDGEAQIPKDSEHVVLDLRETLYVPIAGSAARVTEPFGQECVELSGLLEFESRNALVEALRKQCTSEQAAFLARRADDLWTFSRKITPGDQVVVPTRGWSGIAIGTVTGPYDYRAKAPLGQRHLMPVRWLGEFRARSFDEGMRFSFNDNALVRELSQRCVRQVERLRHMLSEESPALCLYVDPALFHFDRKDYEHLRSASRAQWIAEFLARNKDFVDAYTEWARQGHGPEGRQVIRSKFGIGVERGWSPGRFLGGRKLHVNLRKSVTAFRFIPESEKALAKDLRERLMRQLHRNIHDLDEAFLLQYGGTNTTAASLIASLVSSNEDSPLENLPDTLFLAIRFDRPIDEIKSEIRKIFPLHSKRSRPRSIPRETERYLIIFDLKERHRKTIGEIGTIMGALFPGLRAAKGGPLYDELQTVSNELAKARALINGGYRRYL